MLDDGGPSGNITHKLFSFLPLTKHATFRVTLTIHDVTNIPFQAGSFSLQWKFKNARSNSSGHRLTGSRPATPTDSMSIMTRRRDSADGGRTSAEDTQSIASTQQHHQVQPRLRITAIDTKGQSITEEGIIERPSVTIEPPTPLDGDNQPSASKYGAFLTPSGPASPAVSTPPVVPVTAPSPAPPVPVDGAQKGRTEFAVLKDHTVRWDHTVEVMVPFKIKRDTAELLPCELKLVLQENFTGGASVETITPQRFGVVYLNLAQYADRGPVTRRYLFDESKTNATLRLTIDAVRISGDKDYVVPEIRKGQPVTDVSGVLSTDNFLPLKSPGSLPASAHGSASASQVNLPYTPSPGPGTPRSFASESNRPPFMHKKTSSWAERTYLASLTDSIAEDAENVIDLLFNPVPTSSTSASPFTYYQPRASPTSKTAVGESSGTEEDGTTSSVDRQSISQSSDNHHGQQSPMADDSSASSTKGNNQGHWWRKFNANHSNSSRRNVGASSGTVKMHGRPTMTGREFSESSWAEVAVLSNER